MAALPRRGAVLSLRRAAGSKSPAGRPEAAAAAGGSCPGPTRANEEQTCTIFASVRVQTQRSMICRRSRSRTERKASAECCLPCALRTRNYAQQAADGLGSVTRRR